MNKVIDICHLNIPKEQNNQNSLNAQYSHNSRIYSEHERVLLNTLNKIKEIANYNLTSLGNTKAKQYLLNRGFTKDLIQELQFGYISYEQIQQWIDKKSFPLEYLLKTGFIREDEQGNYHPVFGNRILIPVMDERGNTVTFSGRAIHGEEPKYLHGRNTDIFMKSNHLYNFNVAKNYAYNDKIYVVEGFMDVAGGNKMNIRNIVATMGTSFTKEQIAMLRRLDCEIVLMRDNDNAGRQAMVKEIPELMNKRFRVSVIDLNKVKENLQLTEEKDSKDLWDFANAGAVEHDLEKARVSGFQFLMENKYFENKEFNSETIKEAYEEAKKEELIKTSYDEMNFKDYVVKHSTYSKEEVDDIIHAMSLEEKTNPIFQFQVNLMERYIINNVNTYVNRTGDKTMVEFYQKNYDRIRQNILNRFHEDPTRYLSPELDRVLISALVQDTMTNDEQWLRYETIHKFKHENVFNKTFVKNTIGQKAQMKLNMEQKRLVVKQFEKTFSDNEKLELEHIDELYIVNKYQELAGIIDIEGSDNAKFLLEALEMKWIGKKEGMSVFSYSSIFDKSMLFAIDPKYKTVDGKDFKSILLYNNSGGSLKLTKNNIATPQKSNGKQEVEQSIQKEKTVSKERTFTV
ncbi:toprim domain-containing protein, partial [[Clostridium] innocuum]|nr:toprim domain-containing protein [[Clostridium] innocuum]